MIGRADLDDAVDAVALAASELPVTGDGGLEALRRTGLDPDETCQFAAERGVRMATTIAECLEEDRRDRTPGSYGQSILAAVWVDGLMTGMRLINEEENT